MVGLVLRLIEENTKQDKDYDECAEAYAYFELCKKAFVTK